MKSTFSWIITAIYVALPLAAAAQTIDVDEQAYYAALREQMERACPGQWEDLSATMNTENLVEGADLFQDASDRAAFVALLDEIYSDATEEGLTAQMADDLATVATECASHRVALLDALISKTPREVLLAMDAVNKGLNQSIEYLDGGWSVGDVRITGRLIAQDGWLFLTGQTIGSINSAAQIKGDDLAELFELAKHWAPNAGTESWANNHIVTLPDMRGRALVGADNMGGSSANRISETAADNPGGTFGTQTVALTASQLPTHKHTMSTIGVHGHSLGNAGSHGHTMGTAGSHKHKVKTSQFDGGQGGQRPYFTGYGRDNWQNTINLAVDYSGDHTHSLPTAPSHAHSVTTAGNHAHTINNTGSSGAVKIVQPSIVFNVEMKY